MRTLKVASVVAAVLLVSAVCTANPAPSVIGPTGLITVPGTGLVGANSVDAGAHFWSYDDTDYRVWHVNWGICDDVEVSVAWSVYDGYDWEDENTTFGVKWVPLKEPDDCISLGLGVYNVGSSWGDDDDAVWYIVGSKSLCNLEQGKRPVLFVFGLEFTGNAYGPGDVKDHVLGDWNEDSPNAFFGLNAEVADWVTLICETNEFEDFNYGARFNPCEHLNVDLMSLDFWGESHRFLVGVGYNITWGNDND